MPTATRRTCRTRGIGRTIRGLYKSKPNLVRPTQSAAAPAIPKPQKPPIARGLRWWSGPASIR